MLVPCKQYRDANKTLQLKEMLDFMTTRVSRKYHNAMAGVGEAIRRLLPNAETSGV